MTKSNRDRVSEVMDALREGLGPFVLREYKQYHKGARYLQEIELMLKSGAYSAPHLPDEATALAKVDIHGWLNLMVRQWNDVFRTRLGKAERSFVGELQEARNDWAHQETFTDNDTERIADTATRLLEAIGAAKEAEITRNIMKEVRRISYEAELHQATKPINLLREEIPTAAQDILPETLRETMTVKIMQAVAILVLQEGKTLFAPEEIRQTIGVDHERWGRSYRQFLHAMRVDPPSSAPHIRAKFKGVFRRVERGVYTLTDDGRRLLLTEFKAHALPHSVEQATTAEMQQVTKPSGTPPGEVPTTARDSLPQTTREAMNAKIMRAVAILVLQDGNQEFSREEIRQTIGVDRQKWNYSYTPTFQGMRVDQPGGAPDVRAKFKGVFRRVERGRYTLTEYGKRLLLAEFKAHGLPPAVEQATAKVMPETTSVLTFDNDEAGYLQWVAANAHGYVINAPKRSGDFPDILHRASCIHISSPQRTNYTTTDFKKICSLDRQALVDWGTRCSDDFRECKHCKP